MSGHDSDYCLKRASEARGAAEQKHGGRNARIAGHLALAWDAMARVKKRRELGENELPRSRN